MGRRRARAACPCGLGPAYDACCGRFIGTGTAAPTADLLMRSRYTAYARKDAAHLLLSWHSSSRPERLDLDPDLRWTSLEVVSTTGGGLLDARGTVRFRARAVSGGRPTVVDEDSAFVREGGAWAYLGPVTAASAPGGATPAG